MQEPELIPVDFLDLSTQFNIAAFEKDLEKNADKLSRSQILLIIKNLVRQQAHQRTYLMKSCGDIQKLGIYISDLEYKRVVMEEEIKYLQRDNTILRKVLGDIINANANYPGAYGTGVGAEPSCGVQEGGEFPGS